MERLPSSNYKDEDDSCNGLARKKEKAFAKIRLD